MKLLLITLLFGFSAPVFAANSTSFVIACAKKVDGDAAINGTPERICTKVKSAADVAAVISCAEQATTAGNDIAICAEVMVP